MGHGVLCGVCRRSECVADLGSDCPRFDAVLDSLVLELKDLNEPQLKALIWMATCPDFEGLIALLDAAVSPLVCDLEAALAKIMELAPEGAQHEVSEP